MACSVQRLSTMLTIINAAIRSAASLYTYDPRLVAEPFGEAQFMIVGRSDAIGHVRDILMSAGLEAFVPSTGTLIVRAAQPPAPLVPELDPEDMLDEEQPDAEEPTEYDHEAALEAHAAAWL